MCEAKRAMVVTGIVSVIVIIIIMSIYVSSGGNQEFNMGQGNDVANVKESTGIHLIEVDASNNESWSWLEIRFVVLALKMGLLLSHATHYFCLTKHLVKKKVVRAVKIKMKNVTPPVNNVPGTLQIPALP
jgi:hypothetical protein